MRAHRSVGITCRDRMAVSLPTRRSGTAPAKYRIAACSRGPVASGEARDLGPWQSIVVDPRGSHAAPLWG